LNLRCWPATAAPRASGHPFRSGQISNPIRTITARHSLAARSHTCSSNSFPCGAPALVRYFETRRRIRLTTFPVLPTHLNSGMPVRLAPAYTPMALRQRAHTEKKGNRPFTFWLEPTAAWAHRELRGFHRQFTCVVHAEFAWPSHRTAAGSVDSCLVAKMSRLSRSTLSPRLHTRRSPIAHARVGNCWSYSRSRLQPPKFRLLNVTRQERALPSTTCADLRPADGDTCRTFRVLISTCPTASLAGHLP
jgi:hypothetical protein